MTMPCRISDEHVYNPWEEVHFEEEPPMKSLEDVTLYDLMAEDNYVWVSRNKHNGYILELENDENGVDPYLREVQISEESMESLAYFCRTFLGFYNKISGDYNRE